jgi:hypothetical protein
MYPTRTIDDECRAVGGMRIGRRNRSTRGKPAPVTLCPPQIPHDLTWGSNPGRRGGKLATNCLIYGTVTSSNLYFSCCINSRYDLYSSCATTQTANSWFFERSIFLVHHLMAFFLKRVGYTLKIISLQRRRVTASDSLLVARLSSNNHEIELFTLNTIRYKLSLGI